MIGSLFYFVEALAPYAKCCDQGPSNSNNSTVNSTVIQDDYYYYYSEYLEEHPLYQDHQDGWYGMAASALFDIESSIYIFGWWLGRQQMAGNGDRLYPWYTDWNFWGNILFFFGSLGYNFTDMTYLLSEYDSNVTDTYKTTYNVIYLLLAINFIVDSFCYLIAALGGETSRAPTHSYSQGYTFKSVIDWYLLATILFIIGSFLYLWEAILQLQDRDATIPTLVAAALFVVDAALYITSAFHDRRDQDYEVHVLQRKYYLIIEHSHNESEKLSIFKFQGV